MNHISPAVQTVHDLRHRWKPQKERLHAAGGDQPTGGQKDRQVETPGLVRHKPTAYGRATLGAKPFRRAPK